MTPIKAILNRYGSVYQAAKETGVHAQQLHRWLNAGALVDSDGQVWIKTKGVITPPTTNKCENNA